MSLKLGSEQKHNMNQQMQYYSAHTGQVTMYYVLSKKYEDSPTLFINY